MKINSAFNLSKTYFIVLMGTFITGLSWMGWYFWDAGTLNPGTNATIHEALVKLDDHKDNNKVAKIRALLSNDKSRQALNQLEDLKKRVSRISKSVDYRPDEKLEKSYVALVSGIKKVISLPEANKIHSVFANKVSSFRTFVEYNRWRTLTRLSTRASVIMDSGKNSRYFTASSLAKVVSKMDSIFSTMEKVTNGSVLTDDNKRAILIRVSGLKDELNMLRDYVETVSAVRPLALDFEEQVKAWENSISPALADKKLNYEHSFQNLVFALIGVIAFSVVGLAFGLFVFNREQGKIRRTFESDVSEIMKKALVANEFKLDTASFSEEFRSELMRNREFLHKRISFGSVFQDALPFAAILLDSNLKLCWGNPHFYEQWTLAGLSKRDENISWDYLQRFTNLGENDPVIQALNENIAGIYQIQVRAKSEQEESIPYEMYVSPVEYKKEKRIMIFFYPLRSLQDTIAYQTRSIVGPVCRALDALTTGTFNDGFVENARNDFDVAGIGEVFDKFLKHNDFINGQRNTLLSEIERTENEAFDLYKTINDICKYSREVQGIEMNAIRSFKEVKEKIIELVNMRIALEESQSSTAQKSRQFLKMVDRLNSEAQEVKSQLGETTRAFEGLNRLKANFKDMKVRVDDFRSRIVQSLDQSLLLGKSKHISPERFNQSLNKIKLEIRTFDRVLTDFSQEVTALDVALSKAEIVIGHSRDCEIEDIRNDVSQLVEWLDDDSFKVGKMVNRCEEIDNRVVEGLKKMFHSFNDSRKKANIITDLGSRSLAEYHGRIDEPETEIEEEATIVSVEHENHGAGDTVSV